MFLHLWCPDWSFLGGCSTPEEMWSGWWSGESSWPGGGWRRRRGGREPAPKSWKSGVKIPHRPYNAQNLKLTRQPEEAHSDQVLLTLLVCIHWSHCSEHFLFFKSESCLWMFCRPFLTWPIGQSMTVLRAFSKKIFRGVLNRLGGEGDRGEGPSTQHIATPMQSNIWVKKGVLHFVTVV